MDTWYTIILEWVNCLKFTKPVTTLKELELEKFIHCFFTTIKSDYRSSLDETWDFMEKFLVSDCHVKQLDVDIARCCAGDEYNVMMLLSSLLVHHFLDCRPSEVLNAMSTNLCQETQVVMKAVLETLLAAGSPVTGSTVKSAFLAVKKKPDRLQALSTPQKTSTPKSGVSSPLIALLQSPLAQQQRDLSLKSREIQRLQTELASEMEEKFEYVEQAKTAEKEVKGLKLVLHQRDEQIRMLRQDLAQSCQQLPGKCPHDCREAFFREEVKRLEAEITNMYKELGDMACIRDALDEKVKEYQCQLKRSNDEAYECKIAYDSLKDKLACAMQAHAARTKECEELREILASKNTPGHNASSDDSFLFNQLREGVVGSPENLGDAVVDIMLHEKEEENIVIMGQLESVKSEKVQVESQLKTAEDELEKVRCESQAARGLCEILQHQVQQLEGKLQCAHSELTVATDKLISEQHTLNTVIKCHEEKLADQLQTIENLTSKLEKSDSQNATLMLQSSSLVEKINHLEKVVVISEENSKNLKDNVKQLESLVENQKLKILELVEEQGGYCQQLDHLKTCHMELLIDKEHLQVLKDNLAKCNEENLNKWSFRCEELKRKNEELLINVDSFRSRLEKITLELAKKCEASDVAERCYKTTIDDKELLIKTLTDNKLLLEQSLAEGERERNDLQDSNVKLCEELGLVGNKLHVVTEKFNTLQNQCNELELIKRTQTAALEASHQERDNLLVELQRLRQELAEIDQSKASLESKCNDLTLANKAELHSLSEKCALLESEARLLKDERLEVAERAASLEARLKALEVENESTVLASERVKCDLDDRICNLQAELLTKQGALEECLAELEENRKQIAGLEKSTSETVAAAKLMCDEVAFETSSRVSSLFHGLEEKLGGVDLRLSTVSRACGKDLVCAVSRLWQLALDEKEQSEKTGRQLVEAKEQCERVCKENAQLKKSLLDLKAKFNIKEQELGNLKKSAVPNQHLLEKAIRSEFEGKLDKAKAQMEKLMNEQAEKLKRSQLHERKSLQDQMAELHSRYLKEKRAAEVYKSRCELLKHTRDAHQSSTLFGQSNASSREDVSFRERSKSRRDLGVIQESFTYSRSRRSTVPSETSPVFPMEDEEGELYSKTLDESEVFSGAHLDDLKAGHCDLPDRHRLGELQYRNSLCPPHLKSSYPAETQFSNPCDFKDEDLKMGSAVDIDQSMRLLQSGDRHRRKEKGQTSYNKPGPPTPGKNGRQSLQGHGYTTPRSVLREHNDSRRGNTPRRLKEFFTSAFNLRDENTPVTPRSRRVSFFRKQVKN